MSLWGGYHQFSIAALRGVVILEDLMKVCEWGGQSSGSF